MLLLLLLLFVSEADYNDNEDLALWQHQSNVSQTAKHHIASVCTMCVCFPQAEGWLLCVH